MSGGEVDSVAGAQFVGEFGDKSGIDVLEGGGQIAEGRLAELVPKFFRPAVGTLKGGDMIRNGVPHRFAGVDSMAIDGPQPAISGKAHPLREP